MALGAIGGILGSAAGGAVGKAIVEVVGDSTKLQADLAKAKAQTATATNQMGAQTKKFSALSTGAYVAIGTAAVAGIGFAIKAASDLNEQMNRTKVVFGESADSVIAFSETSAKSLGLAQSAALEGAASFGALFDSAGLAETQSAKMSTTFLTLAADMASFNNQDPSEMLVRLRAGLSGEAEPLRRFGVFLDEARVKAEAYASGIAEVGEELTAGQKVQARFNIIMQDTNKQQGDFARTVGESLPNQLRVFKAELTDSAAVLGQTLLPVITKVVQAFNMLAPLLPTIVTGAVALGAAFLAYKALAFVPVLLFQIGLGLEKIRLQQAASAVGNFAGSLSALLPALGSVAIGIGALILAGEGLQGFINNITNTVSTEQALATVTTQLTAAVASGKFTWDEIRGAIDRYNETIGSLPGAEQLTMHAIRGTAGAAEDLNRGHVKLAAGTQALTGETRELAQAHADDAAAAQEQLSAELALAGGLAGVVSAVDAASDAERTLGEARAEVARLTKEGKKGSQEYKDAVEAVNDAASGSLQSQLALAGAVQKFATEAAKTGNVQGAIDRVKDFGAKAGLTKTEINKMVDQVKDAIKEIGKMPGAVKVDFSTPGLDTTLNRIQTLKDRLANIPDTVTTRFVIIGSEINPRPGQAAGGIIAGASGFITRGPTMLVGESRKMTFAGKGAEAVIPFDNRGIGILAKALEKAGSGSGGEAVTNLYLNVQVEHAYGDNLEQIVVGAMGRAVDRFGMR